MKKRHDGYILQELIGGFYDVKTRYYVKKNWYTPSTYTYELLGRFPDMKSAEEAMRKDGVSRHAGKVRMTYPYSVEGRFSPGGW